MKTPFQPAHFLLMPQQLLVKIFLCSHISYKNRSVSTTRSD